MVRSLIADENLLSTLLGYSVADAVVPGLIVGQSSEQKDYVVHFARSPAPDGGGGDSPSVAGGPPAKVLDIDDKQLTVHARNLTRMLPGGMWVLGLFVVGSGDIFSDRTALNKIRLLVNHVNNSCKSNPHMNGKCPNSCIYVLHLCPLSKKYVCKSFEVENLNSSVKQVTLKFNPQPVHWYQIDCCFNMNSIAPFYFSKEMSNVPLKKKLKEILNLLCESVESAVCALNGRVADQSETLESVKKKLEELKKKDGDNESISKNNDIFNAHLYIPQKPRNENEDIKVEIIKSAYDLQCSGRLSSRVFMHNKATVEEASKAIKEDITRSWAARLEMHWDSYDETLDNKKPAKKVLHCLPRRVLCKLPKSIVSLSEYIFPDEDIADVIISLEEQLGISINPSAVDDTFEQQYDSNKTDSTNPESYSDTTENNRRPSKSTNSMFLMVGIIVAALVLIISVILQLNMK